MARPEQQSQMMRELIQIFLMIPRGQRIFLGVLALLIAVPFSLLIGLQVYNAANLAVLGGDISVRENAWKAEAHELNAQIDPESLKSPANQFAYRLLANHSELVPERRIIVTVQVPLGDMKISKAQEIPFDDLVNKASGEVQERGEKECGLILGTLASKCTVMSAIGRPVGTKAYEYQMQLAFAEIKPFGKVERKKTYEFIVTRSSPGRAATQARIYFDKSDRMRERIYSDVADTCAAIREKSGNCSVTEVSIASKIDRGTPMVRLSASAAYASLATASELASITH
jgi:hypothetical protein